MQSKVSSPAAPLANADFVKFPTTALPQPVCGFVRATAKSLHVDESYVALPLLSALAAAVGNTRRIQLKSDWCEPCVIWTAVIGQSGTGKSPAFAKAVKPLHDRQELAFRDYDIARPQHELELARHKAAVEAWKHKGKSTDEPPPEAPTPPTPKRYVANDVTVEALAPLLKDNPRGILLAREELSGWFASFDAYKKSAGADASHWLSMFGAAPLTVDRKSSDRPLLYVPRAAVCITGGIQPVILATALHGRDPGTNGTEHIDNGMAARLLMAYPPPEPALWSEDTVDRSVLDAVERLYDDLLSLDFHLDKHGQPVPFDLPLTPDAKTAFVEFHDRLVEEQMHLPSELAAVWSKLRGYAARFALVVRLIREHTGEAQSVTNAIDWHSMEQGLRIADWFGNEAKRVYGLIQQGPLGAEARQQAELVRYIRERGGCLTVRELMNSGPQVYRRSNDVAEGALEALVKAELGRWEYPPQGKKGGRPTRTFHLGQCDISV